MLNPFKLIAEKYRIYAYIATFIALAILILILATKYYNWAYRNGVTDERLAWQTRENDELVQAKSKISELTNKAREDENKNSENLATISTYYEEVLKNEKIKTEKVIADINNGVVRLRDKYATTSKQTTCSSGTSETSTTTSERNGQTGGELSTTASTFLYQLTGESDQIVEQLTACQNVIIENQRACGISSVKTE